MERSLALNDLSTVQDELYSVREKWYDIGVRIFIPVTELDIIKKQYKDDFKDCLREMLKFGLRSHNIKLSWKIIVGALQKPVVNELGLALEIEKKFSHYEEHPPPVKRSRVDTSESVVHVHEKMVYFNELFSSLVQETLHYLRGKQPFDSVRDYLILLTGQKRERHRNFFVQNVSSMLKATTITEIFAILANYWTYFNYTLLEYIITEFGDSDLKEKVKKYVQDFKEFRATVKLKDIFGWQFSSLPEGYVKIVEELSLDPNVNTLEDVEIHLIRCASSNLAVRYLSMLIEVTPGSITLVWGLPRDFVPDLVETFNHSFIEENNIDSVLIDDFDLKHYRQYEIDQPMQTEPSEARHENISETENSWTHYESLLIAEYKSMPEIPPNQWHPVEEAQDVNLARITQDFMSRHDIFSRSTIHGSTDDIQRRKEAISYEQMLTDNTGLDRVVMLIEGRPGVGKTTLITKISKDWANQKVLPNVELLISVPIRRFINQDLDLKDLLGLYCKSSTLLDSLCEEIQCNDGKGVCFAIDGLDEYDQDRMLKGNFLYDVIYGHQLLNASVIVTSRPTHDYGLFRQQTINHYHLEILGFQEDQITKFVQSYMTHCSRDEDKSQQLLEFLEQNPNIKRMCYLPLHLAMVVYVYDHGTDLPSTETEMCMVFTLHILICAMEREIGASKSYDMDIHSLDDLPEDKRRMFNGICLLALEATRKKQQVFIGKDILKKKIFSGWSEDELNYQSLGLLTIDKHAIERTLEMITVSFLHATLQEFLAGLYIAKLMTTTEQLCEIKKNGGAIQMRAVWKFYCGVASKHLDQKQFLNFFDEIVKQNLGDRLAVLHTIRCAFESQQSEACSHLLEFLNGVVDIKDITLSPSDCLVLGYVAANAPDKVKDLDLSYCHIGPTGISALVEQLDKLQLHDSLINAALLRLRARADPLGCEGAIALSQLLKRLPNLSELRLYGNNLQTHAFQYLAPVIANLSNIRILILSKNSLMESTGALVSDILSNLTLVHTFYISYNPIKDAGLADMMPGLLKCKTLKILGLRCTSLTEGAGLNLSKILFTLSNLKWLELYQNCLRDDGVVEMLPGLRAAKSLEMISLVENGISDTGAVALAEYLKETNTLQLIRLYYNHMMSDTGKYALRTAVGGRSSELVELKMAL